MTDADTAAIVFEVLPAPEGEQDDVPVDIHAVSNALEDAAAEGGGLVASVEMVAASDRLKLKLK